MMSKSQAVPLFKESNFSTHPYSGPCSLSLLYPRKAVQHHQRTEARGEPDLDQGPALSGVSSWLLVIVSPLSQHLQLFTCKVVLREFSLKFVPGPLSPFSPSFQIATGLVPRPARGQLQYLLVIITMPSLVIEYAHHKTDVRQPQDKRDCLEGAPQRQFYPIDHLDQQTSWF